MRYRKMHRQNFQQNAIYFIIFSFSVQIILIVFIKHVLKCKN